MEQFFKVIFDLFFVASKRLISFITIGDRISSYAGIVLWFSLSWILCFDFKCLIKQSVLEPPLFVWRSTNCTLVLVEPRCSIRNALSFWFSLIANVFILNAWLKIYLKSLLKQSQIFCGKLLQTEKERIDFAKNHSL